MNHLHFMSYIIKALLAFGILLLLCHKLMKPISITIWLIYASVILTSFIGSEYYFHMNTDKVIVYTLALPINGKTETNTDTKKKSIIKDKSVNTREKESDSSSREEPDESRKSVESSEPGESRESVEPVESREPLESR